MKKYSKEEAVELINDYRKMLFGLPFSEFTDIEPHDEFLREKGLLQEPLEVGKWYYHKGNTFSEETSFFCITSFGKTGHVYGYGFNEKQEWIVEDTENGTSCMSNDASKKYLVKATDEEVKEALIAEAVKNNYRRDKMDMFSYNTTYNQLMITYNGGGARIIYDNGVWRENKTNTTLNNLKKKYKELGKEIDELECE